ncbi:hypothetical protein AAFF_G00331580 [Aldrovandia affinis]|uniref:Uncharacterized protein n=1 Tax=Aldrovandia affinis TaxID=143900 RepID=A0AAD7WPL9_9TELE|nr:hypothetical protein AAFF_G00331580 [Aldrovandia affinis]
MRDNPSISNCSQQAGELEGNGEAGVMVRAGALPRHKRPTGSDQRAAADELQQLRLWPQRRAWARAGLTAVSVRVPGARSHARTALSQLIDSRVRGKRERKCAQSPAAFDKAPSPARPCDRTGLSAPRALSLRPLAAPRTMPRD